MNFCNDCKYAERNALGDATETSTCQHPKAIIHTPNLVTGFVWERTRGCTEMRSATVWREGFEGCDPDAKFFEPRE